MLIAAFALGHPLHCFALPLFSFFHIMASFIFSELIFESYIIVNSCVGRCLKRYADYLVETQVLDGHVAHKSSHKYR